MYSDGYSFIRFKGVDDGTITHHRTPPTAHHHLAQPGKNLWNSGSMLYILPATLCQIASRIVVQHKLASRGNTRSWGAIIPKQQKLYET